jgi:hypothetical protein
MGCQHENMLAYRRWSALSTPAPRTGFSALQCKLHVKKL